MPDTSMAPSRSQLITRLAFGDYRHEWVISACSVLALAAVLIPLLVLFGLKYGLISNLLDPLVENPRYREITPLASGSYDNQWLATLEARADVEFIVPRTRSIAASMRLRAPESPVGRIIDVELIPSATGDPALAGVTTAPSGLAGVVISFSAADRLNVNVGDRLEGLLTRTRRDTQETERLPLEVVGIAPAGAFARDGLFVSVPLIGAVEDFLDGRAVPALGWDGSAARDTERRYAGFRLYARSIDDVATLRQVMLNENIEVRTSVADISLVQTLDRNLAIAYWIIALIAIAGYCASFAATVWANIDRKQREFSVLRLIGFRTAQIVWFPILQAAFTALLAWTVAAVAYFMVQAVLNGLFAPNIGDGQPICRLRAVHLIAALVITLAAATLSAAIGGRKVAGLEPSLGLRDG
jgi:putative ABC transport system permease protein